jgi:glucosamine--fructose-6-phosphate aminotransferase (isomerizing)
MCGIIGILGTGDVIGKIVGGLKRLEYRGYDSAGVATLADGRILRRRAVGRIVNLELLLEQSPLHGSTGLGHTRWATHGRPTENNAHPHATEKVAVVHNGIIENYGELRTELEAEGHAFTTETDTEVIAHLLTSLLATSQDPVQATMRGVARLEGAFSLGIVFAGWPDVMIGARRGSPLAIGHGEGEMLLGSDAVALAPYTNRICYLEDDDCAVMNRDRLAMYNRGKPVRRDVHQTALSSTLISKGDYDHFMMKEIAEQPEVTAATLRSLIDPLSRGIALPFLPVELATLSRLTIIGCGTAYYAGCVAKYWLEEIARLPVDIDVASEFRYRNVSFDPHSATMVISQSGETADTLAALRYARSQGQKILAVLNVPSSTMAREADAVLGTLAGPEIGVASTKAFTTQLVALAAFCIAAAKARGVLDAGGEEGLIAALVDIPARIAEVLEDVSMLKATAVRIAESRDALFIGRGTSYPIAMEGALKLKEITYIHAEGYAAGEMKHGPIALVDEGVPVVVVAPRDSLFEKVASNLQEVRARGGRVILLSDSDGIRRLGAEVSAAIELPTADPFVAPILYAIPVQLLAYHAAVAKGTDVDKPRNLAKSVTVE